MDSFFLITEYKSSNLIFIPQYVAFLTVLFNLIARYFIESGSSKVKILPIHDPIITSYPHHADFLSASINSGYYTTVILGSHYLSAYPKHHQKAHIAHDIMINGYC